MDTNIVRGLSLVSLTGVDYSGKMSVADTSYVDGGKYLIKPDTNSVLNATLNINSIGAKNIVTSSGANITANALVAGKWYEVVYNAVLDKFEINTLGGAGGVGGSGTLTFIPKWTPDGSTLGNSLLSDDGTNVMLTGGKYITSQDPAKVQIDLGNLGGEYFQVTNDGGAGLSANIFLHTAQATFAHGTQNYLNLLPNGNAVLASTHIFSISSPALIFGGSTTTGISLGTSGPAKIIIIGKDNSDSTIIRSLLQYIDGNEAVGYVLTSDASGNATWQAPPGGVSVWSIGSLGNYSIKASNDTSTDATGDYAYAEGAYVTASGDNSHAEGNFTIASGDNSHAENSGTTSSGIASHAEGTNTTSIGQSSHSEGNGCSASGDNSHAEGNTTVATGPASHSEGTFTQANNANAHAEGDTNIASGVSSHVEGSGNTASGAASHAEGTNTQSIGDASHAEGTTSISSGANSHTEGFGNTASGDNSHAQGAGGVASGLNSHTGGSLAQASATNSFNHSNANTAGSSEASGVNSAILGGEDNNATGLDSAVIGGQGNTVNGTNSVILAGTSITENDSDTATAPCVRVINKLKVSRGVDLPSDTITLGGTGTDVISNNSINAGAMILLTYDTLNIVAGSETLQAPSSGITPGFGGSFTIISAATNTSIVNYLIINP